MSGRIKIFAIRYDRRLEYIDTAVGNIRLFNICLYSSDILNRWSTANSANFFYTVTVWIQKPAGQPQNSINLKAIQPRSRIIQNECKMIFRSQTVYTRSVLGT